MGVALDRPEPPVAMTPPRIVAQLDRVEQQLKQLRPLQRTGDLQAPAESRTQAPPKDSPQLLPQRLDRIEQLLHALLSQSEHGTSARELAALRDQSPLPNHQAVRRLADEITKDPSLVRSHWFSTPADILRTLGSPSVLLFGDWGQRWEYRDASGSLKLTIEFSRGLVTGIH
jgi:hypothetical protein